MSPSLFTIVIITIIIISPYIQPFQQQLPSIDPPTSQSVWCLTLGYDPTLWAQFFLCILKLTNRAGFAVVTGDTGRALAKAPHCQRRVRSRPHGGSAAGLRGRMAVPRQ